MHKLYRCLIMGIQLQRVVLWMPMLDIHIHTLINEGPNSWQNMFTLMRFRCIEVLFYTFYYCWGKESYLLY